MGETCHTTSGGVESRRLNIEREAWAANPPAILHYSLLNASERERWTDTDKCVYCIQKHLHRHMKARICMETGGRLLSFRSRILSLAYSDRKDRK